MLDNKAKLKRKAQKLLDNNGNEYLAQLDAILEVGDKLEELTGAIKSHDSPLIELNLKQTDTHLQGILAELKKKEQPEEITYSISRADRDKLRGKNGYTPKKGVDYFNGYTPKKGVDYFDGKDGSIIERDEIVRKINAGDINALKIDASQITGLPEFTREVVREVGMGFVETPLKAGGGISITKDASGANVVSSTSLGGGSVSFGTTTQIPYMNAGGTDFDYSSNFVFTGTKFNLTGADLSEVSNITSNIATTINNRTVRIVTNNNQTSGSGTATGGLFVQTVDNGITTGGASMATLGMQFSVSRSTTFNNSGIAGTLRAVQGTVSDQGIYSRASTQTVTQDAFQGTLTHSPTITGGQSLTHTVSALNVNFAGDATVTSGSWTANVYGVRFTGGGAVAGTTTYRAFYNSAGSYDTNWTFYNDTANNNFLGYDNSKTYFGTGADASIYYDGTNMYVNPKEVGTGALVLSGDVGVGVIPRTALDVTGNIITSWADNFIGIQYQTGTAYKMGLTADTALRTLVIGTYSGDGTGEIIFKTGTVASPTEKVRIQYDGKVAINKTSTANSMLDIEDTGTTFYPSANIYRNSTNAPAYSSAIYGRFSTNQTSASFTGEQVALTGEMWLSGNQNWTGNGLQGASGAIGVLGRVEHRSGTFSIANASGFISQAEVATNGTITKFTGYRALNPTGSGTLTNNYGFYVNTLSKGSTSNWAFYAETNPSYFGGGVVERVVTTTDDATAVIDVAVTDTYELSAIANATTFSTTGTPTDGQEILIRFKDAGVAKGLTWDAIFVEIGQTLPIITIAGKWHYVGVKYNSSASKFHVLAVSVQT